MACYINKAIMVALANEVSEYLERYAAVLPSNATVELEELGEQVTFAMLSAVAALADDPASESLMKGHLLFGAMHAGLFSALNSHPPAVQPPLREGHTKVTVN